MKMMLEKLSSVKENTVKVVGQTCMQLIRRLKSKVVKLSISITSKGILIIEKYIDQRNDRSSKHG